MPWFMEGITSGNFEVENPYNRRLTTVAATPDRIHTIIFWSKNFGPFLSAGHGERLREIGFNLFFNFTVNSANDRLEPNVPPLSERLDQLAALCDRFGPPAVQWRFDPICHYADKNGIRDHNLQDFRDIAQVAARCGVRCCVTSFMDMYRKVVRRAASVSDVVFIEPSIHRKVEIISRMEKYLTPLGMQLYICCESAVQSALPSTTPVAPSACIPGPYLADLYGGSVVVKPDRGQRAAQGCRCSKSVDIGSYRLHPCRHDCLYCYANPVR